MLNKDQLWWPSCLASGGIVGYNFARRSSKEHCTKVLVILAEQFQRRRFSLVTPSFYLFFVTSAIFDIQSRPQIKRTITLKLGPVGIVFLEKITM